MGFIDFIMTKRMMITYRVISSFECFIYWNVLLTIGILNTNLFHLGMPIGESAVMYFMLINLS